MLSPDSSRFSEVLSSMGTITRPLFLCSLAACTHTAVSDAVKWDNPHDTGPLGETASLEETGPSTSDQKVAVIHFDTFNSGDSTQCDVMPYTCALKERAFTATIQSGGHYTPTSELVYHSGYPLYLIPGGTHVNQDKVAYNSFNDTLAAFLLNQGIATHAWCTNDLGCTQGGEAYYPASGFEDFNLVKTSIVNVGEILSDVVAQAEANNGPSFYWALINGPVHYPYDAQEQLAGLAASDPELASVCEGNPLTDLSYYSSKEKVCSVDVSTSRATELAGLTDTERTACDALILARYNCARRAYDELLERHIPSLLATGATVSIMFDHGENLPMYTLDADGSYIPTGMTDGGWLTDRSFDHVYDHNNLGEHVVRGEVMVVSPPDEPSIWTPGTRADYLVGGEDMAASVTDTFGLGDTFGAGQSYRLTPDEENVTVSVLCHDSKYYVAADQREELVLTAQYDPGENFLRSELTSWRNPGAALSKVPPAYLLTAIDQAVLDARDDCTDN